MNSCNGTQHSLRHTQHARDACTESPQMANQGGQRGTEGRRAAWGSRKSGGRRDCRGALRGPSSPAWGSASNMAEPSDAGRVRGARPEYQRPAAAVSAPSERAEDKPQSPAALPRPPRAHLPTASEGQPWAPGENKWQRCQMKQPRELASERPYRKSESDRVHIKELA